MLINLKVEYIIMVQTVKPLNYYTHSLSETDMINEYCELFNEWFKVQSQDVKVEILTKLIAKQLVKIGLDIDMSVYNGLIINYYINKKIIKYKTSITIKV